MASELNLPKRVNMKCLFCGGETFEFEQKEEYAPEDIFKCATCGEENTHEGLLAVTKEDVLKTVSAEFENIIKKRLKKHFN
ncbi:hypothetical protein [Terasakiella sp.]|uniref:hypothetical protein n=1 Tax=Terasakiella sp. TaxID=2034861 RepID=UPI003AA7E8B4